MASPFTVFRKNQKVLLAITGILAMIAFVFLGTCVQSPTPVQASNNPTVVTWKFGEITEYEMENRLGMRRILNQFIAQAASLGGQPNVQGIFPESEELIVRSMVLARRGRELGLVISDDMVNQFLQQVTFNRVRPDDLERIIASYRLPGGQRVSSQQIFDALREELLSIRVVLLFLNGLGVADETYLRPLDTPAERWDYFRRLERQATVQVLPVAVAEFTEDVGKPSEEQLQELFEKYKQEFPSPESPEPGFRQPYRAKFQYFRADVEELITAEMKNISDEAVREYYEKNKDKEFRKLNLSPLDNVDEIFKPGAEAEKGESKTDDATDSKEGDAKKTDGEKSDGKKTDEKKADDEGDDKKIDDKKIDDKKIDDTNASKDAGEPKPQPIPEKSDQKPEGSEKSSQGRSFSPFRFVNFQDVKEAEKEGKTEAAKTEAKTDTKAQPETDAAKNEDADKGDAKSQNEKTKPQETSKAGDESTAKDTAAKTPSKDGDAAKEPAESKSAAPAPVEYRPLDQVQEEIRRTLAREPVQKQVDERLEKLREEMNSYARVMASYRRAAARDPNEPRPRPFALEALAEKHGVKAFTTEFISRVDAQTNESMDIAKSRDMNPKSPSFFQPWLQVAFQPKGLLRPMTTRDVATGASFLSWKIDEREGNIPEFKAVRDEVLEAWKRIKARDLALKKATEHAEMVRKAGQPMKEVFAKEKDLPVSEVGPFSWLTRPSVPFGTQQAPPSHYPRITGVENPGEDFMATTFGLQPSEVGVALNHPKSIAYVIYAVKFEPTDAVLEQEFMVKIREYDRYSDAGRVKRAEAQNDWMESLLAEYDVEWQRPPALRLAAEE
jgi:hypothetical protein